VVSRVHWRSEERTVLVEPQTQIVFNTIAYLSVIPGSPAPRRYIGAAQVDGTCFSHRGFDVRGMIHGNSPVELSPGSQGIELSREFQFELIRESPGRARQCLNTQPC